MDPPPSSPAIMPVRATAARARSRARNRGRSPATLARSAKGRSAAPPVRLRRYRASDYAPVLALWKRAGLGIGPSDERPQVENSRRRDPDLFLVAECGGAIVGVVLGRWDGRRGWVNHLAVDEAHRGRGVGRQLMAALEGRLRARGCEKVNLHVEPANAGVCEFYSRVGYERRDLIFMQKWLAPVGGRGRRATPATRSG